MRGGFFSLKLLSKFVFKMATAKCHKCEVKCGKGKAHPDVIKEMEQYFKDYMKADSTSYLKRYLTPDIFNRLKTKKTSFGNSLLDCARSGFENPDSSVGLYAADPECYTLFEDIFDPIIEEYHDGFKKSDRHPATDWGDVNSIGNIDPKGDLVVSTRIRCARMLEGYPFNPGMTEEIYREIEGKVSEALSTLDGELKGNFFPVEKMTKETKQKLIDDHFLFKEGDRFLQSANACTAWPAGRGIYYNDPKTFLVWVNEEDHMRIISMQNGGNLGEVYKRFVTAVTELGQKLKFMKNDRFGYLTFCPTNLGTTIRASVHVKLEKLSQDMQKLNDLASKYHLQVRGTAGEHSKAVGAIYDVSNMRRLGLTEYQVIKEMFDGVSAIIKQEREAK